MTMCEDLKKVILFLGKFEKRKNQNYSILADPQDLWDRIIFGEQWKYWCFR